METIFSNNHTESIDIASLLGTPTAAPMSISGFVGMSPDSTNLMSQASQDLQNSVFGTQAPAEEGTESGSTDSDTPELFPKTEEEKAVEAEEKKAGRPKSDKNALISYLNDKIAKEEFAVFGDYDDKTPIEDYLASLPEKRLYELFDKNIETAKTSVREELEKTAQEEFYNSLPYELKAAYEYAANGGQDWGEFYNTIANAQYNINLDPANDDHQELIARNYLQSANFGTPQIIEEQIAEWKNDGKLGIKAQQFKPMLDQLHSNQIEEMNRQQAAYYQQEQQRAQQYVQSIEQTLAKGELGGIKIDKKLQRDLFNGLTRVSEQWGNTNELEHLWNKVNFQEPNPDKIARLHWFLKDEESFLNAVRQQGANKQAENTFNELKKLKVTHQSGSDVAERIDTTKKPVKKFQPTLGGFFG